MVEEERGRAGACSGRESCSDRENAIREERSGGGLVGGDEGGHLGAAVLSSILEENVFDDGLVDHRASVLEQGDQSAVFEVTVTPEVDSRGVAVVFDELATAEANVGEEVVVGGGSDEGGANSKERDVDCPEVFEGRANREERVEADQGLVSVSATIERSDQLNNQATNGLIELVRDDEEEGVVREEGDDESVDEEDPVRNGKVLEDVLGPLQPGDRLLEGALEDVGKSHLAANDNPQVGRRGAEGKIGPGAADELSTEGVVGGGRGRGDNATFVTIDTQPRETREDGDEDEGW